MINASTITRSALPGLLCAAFAVGAQAQLLVTDPNNTSKMIPGRIILDDATAVVKEAKLDPGMQSLIFRARAILIVPRYEDSPSTLTDRLQNKRVSGTMIPVTQDLVHHGSPGVFLLRDATAWSFPVFFGIAQGSTYAKDTSDLYPSGTSLVMVFNNDRAARELRLCPTGTCWLSDMKLANYSDDPRATLADADVVVWSPDRGAKASSLQNDLLQWREVASNAVYQNQATLYQILTNQVTPERPTELQRTLSTFVATSERAAPHLE